MKRDINVVFEGSIPENYDRYLGPVLFEPFADDIVARLKKAQPESVLELACGSGILTASTSGYPLEDSACRD
jgi:ubiquinone/menaquinone biosynthesis C-methylase UbiE